MSHFNVIPTALEGLQLIEPTVIRDKRGHFLEWYNRSSFRAIGITDEFVQENSSWSHQGVLRGLHYQWRRPQAKLVRVTRGRVFDVVVDIRRGSPTFGQWAGAELSEDNHLCLYATKGFAHGFLVLSDVADFQYKCSDFYSAPDDREFLFDRVADPAETRDLAGLVFRRDEQKQMRDALIARLKADGMDGALDGDGWQVYPRLEVLANPDAGLLSQDPGWPDMAIPGYSEGRHVGGQ